MTLKLAWALQFYCYIVARGQSLGVETGSKDDIPS